MHPEKHDNCCNKRISGSILLELNIIFLIIVMVSGVYCNMSQTVLKNYRKILADIEIAQAARYKLSKDLNNRDQIVCRKTVNNTQSNWYLSSGVLYRKTMRGAATGTNPFSDPDVQITGFKTIPLGKEKLGIVINLREPETGLERQAAFSVFLSNGFIVQ